MHHWCPMPKKKTTGLGAYAVWQAATLHFRESVDLVQYQGRVRISRDKYWNGGTPRAIFNRLAENWTTDQLLSIYSIGFSRYNMTWPGELYNLGVIQELWPAWKSMWSENPEYWFAKEVKTSCREFLAYDSDVLELFKSPAEGDDYPAVLQAAQGGALSPESLVVLDQLTGWTWKLDPIYTGDLVWEEYTRRVRAYSKVLVVDDLDWKSLIAA